MHIYVNVSSFLMNSPTSAWWNTTMDMGSTRRHSWVDLAATPKPWQIRHTTGSENVLNKDKNQPISSSDLKFKLNYSSKYGILNVWYIEYAWVHSNQAWYIVKNWKQEYNWKLHHSTSQCIGYSYVKACALNIFSMSCPNRIISSGWCTVISVINHNSYKTYQGHISHGVDHNSLVLHSVLSDSPEPRF